ncbi:chymotrypsin-C-like [Anopheles cruzii]|uniref:chymotrypsin-C-like n=1 Tax=Anopheles cruzii TaxID=68878 RepID=UPI0022EC401D|nr:chymotrypsin-C-like [Anopheles cruzii]
MSLLLLSLFALFGDGSSAEAAQCGVRQIKTRQLLTNGYETQVGDYPWHTAIFQLRPKPIYVCGGTLLTAKVIVTSAHCVTMPGQSKARKPEDLLAKLGKYTLEEDTVGVQEHALAQVFPHETFSLNDIQDDIALLVTKDTVRFDDYVQPACLPGGGPQLAVSVIGTVVGWGYTEGKRVANVLRAATAPIVSHRQCLESNSAAFGGTLNDNMFCAGWRNGTSPCNGDSGGGLFVRGASGSWTLLGIVAFSASAALDENFCSTSDYTVFVDVAKYMMWIRRKLMRRDPGTRVVCGSQSELPKRYIVQNSRNVTFLEAWRLCQGVGHRLATITSKDDSRLIGEAIKASSNPNGPWWIGGTDLGSEGTFVWISTNQPVGYGTGYLDYSAAQPDNAGGNENCLEIGRWGGVVWNDIPCDWKLRYICEHVG